MASKSKSNSTIQIPSNQNDISPFQTIQSLITRTSNATKLADLKPVITKCLQIMSTIFSEQQKQLLELTKQNQEILKQNSDILQNLTKPSLPLLPDSTLGASISHGVDKELLRSVVIAGIDESLAEKPSDKHVDDQNAITELFDNLQIEVSIDKCYRLGQPKADKPQLMKVVFATSKHQQSALQAAKDQLKELNGIRICPSFSKDQLQNITAKWKIINEQLKSQYPEKKFCVYAGEICTSTGPNPKPTPFTTSR
uniref:Uncharacterized protein n=1 Tax=Panagrolaimus sp. ES5 TaxID=591445 RepID=A0AC34GDV8_9BILA